MIMLPDGQAVSAAIFGWLLLPLAILDYQKLWLPNRLVLAVACVGLLVGPILTPDNAWSDRLIAVASGFLSLEAIRLAFKRLRHVDGMGAGDPKLFAALGLWLGWQMLPITLLLACLLGFSYIFATYARGGNLAKQLPLGSFLCFGAFLVAIGGPAVFPV